MSQLSPVPRMVRAGRTPADVDPAAMHRCGMTELFGRDIEVAGIAKVAGVLVIVAAAQGKRVDVIDDGGNACTACLGAALAKPVGAT